MNLQIPSAPTFHTRCRGIVIVPRHQHQPIAYLLGVLDNTYVHIAMESNCSVEDAPMNGRREEELLHQAEEDRNNRMIPTTENPRVEEVAENEDFEYHAAQALLDAGVVIADRQESCDFDDLEAGSLPVIELPRVYENTPLSSSTAPPSRVPSATAAMAMTSTTVCSSGTDGVRKSNDITTSTVVVESLTAGVVEAPLDGTMTLADLEAAPIAQLVKDPPHYDCCGTMTAADSTDCDGVQSETSSQALPAVERRAEFISGQIYKPKTTTSHAPKTADAEVDDKDTEDRNSQYDLLGMDLISNENGDVLISRIDPDSLMAKTPFQVGDRLLSVNQKRCYVMDAKDVVQFMATLEGNVTIVVHNDGGDPNLVESMITKPSLDHRCGLGLASTGRLHLKISNIDADGLFFDTLLNVGDPVVSINGEECEICDAQDAGEIIARAGIYITIKARTLLETGVVVAAFSCNNSTGSTIPPEIVHALDPDNANAPSVKQLAGLTAIAVILICLLLATGLLN